jgi:proteasome maturation protein
MRLRHPHFLFILDIMSNTLRIVPDSCSVPAEHSIKETANELGVHDTLRYGPKSFVSSLTATHPLEHRLRKWDETQDDMKLEISRRIFGIHAPVRLLMERSLVSQTRRHPALPSSQLGLDILMGRDESIGVEDVLLQDRPSYDLFDAPHAQIGRLYGL